MSGKWFNAIGYDVDKESELIDYDNVEKIALENKPKLIIAGFSAYMGIVDWKRFREIADRNKSFLLVDMAHVSGLVAGGVYPNPVEYAHVVTSTTHKSLRGPRSGIILSNEDEEFQKKLNFGVFPGSQGGPLMHVIAAKAVCFKEAMTDDFVNYQKQIIKNAKSMCEDFQKLGFETVQPQTDNHLLLLDLRNKNITGKDAEAVLGKAEITVNKNMVPFDDKSPFVTSGIRIGTAAVTTRGLKEDDMIKIVDFIDKAINNNDDEQSLKQIAADVKDFMSHRPLFVN